MKSRLCLILYGVIILLAFFSRAEKDHRSLSRKEFSPKIEISTGKGKKHTKTQINQKNERSRTKKKRQKWKRKQMRKLKDNSLKKRKLTKVRSKSRSINGNCVESSVTVMRKWKDIVGNFQKQKKRIEKQTSVAIKKFGKKSVFSPIAMKLVLAGGGNKANLTCGGSTDSAGAKQLANLTSTLLECEQNIDDQCSPQNFPKPDYIVVEICTLHIKNFEQEATRCMGLSKESSAEAACDCWTGEDMSRFSDAVQQCKIQAVANIAAGLKNCTGAFSKCRKYEDSVISTIQACPQTSDQLNTNIDSLSKNKEALETVQDVVTSLNESSTRQNQSPCGILVDFITNSK